MKTMRLVGFGFLFVWGMAHSQNPILQGRILEYLSLNPIQGVRVQLEATASSVQSDEKGYFTFQGHTLPLGEQSVFIEKTGYQSKRLSIRIEQDGIIDLNPVFLQNDWQRLDTEIGVISLTEDELINDDFEVTAVPGVLQATKDVFEQAAAYDFSGAYFRPRGLEGHYSKLFVNGIEFNSMEHGRPLWNIMGGLNDVQRNREGVRGFSLHRSGFGDLGNNTYFTMRASKYRKGGGVSFARANRSYQNRIMASYHSGLTNKGWSYSILASLRQGNQGYVEGTNYDAKSLFVALEKVGSLGNSFNLTAFYAPNQRGRSTPLTNEVLRLKGNRYNPNWGYQNGKIRNSRVGKVGLPVLILSHFSSPNKTIQWENHVSLSFGEESTSRIDNSGVRNPYPHYYQRLPSYFLQEEAPSVYDYQMAYWAREQLIKEGQFSWQSLYQTNQSAKDALAKYVLTNDISKNRQISVASSLYSKSDHRYKWFVNLDYTNYRAEKFAEIIDLLGAFHFLDTDSFYDGNEEGYDQSDVNNVDRLVGEGEPYKYNYALVAERFRGAFQWQGKFNGTKTFIGLQSMYSRYQREGFFRNGYFQEAARSLGKSEALSFFSYTSKAGLSHQWNAKHYTDGQVWYGNRPPLLRNSFANARQNNDLVDRLESEINYGGLLGYRYRTPSFHIDLTAFYIVLQNLTEIGFFFTQNAIGLENNSAFVQEIVQGMDKKQLGLECGIKWQFHPSINLKAALAIGKNIYSSIPSIYLAGDDFDYQVGDGFVEGNDLASRGRRNVFLRNVHVAAGPEQAYKMGFEYRDPDYWWTGLSINYFSHSFIDPSSLRRSEDFISDVDGLPLADYEPGRAKELLHQERLKPFSLVNLVGGKSWKLKQYYLGIFASISNLLNQNYRTGGFEDSRYSSYHQQLQEQTRSGGPLFGNRYFSGLGTTYFLSLSLRF